MLTEAEIRLANERLWSLLQSGQEKVAIDAVNDYTRTKMREDGFTRRWMEPISITNADFDRQADTVLPVKVIDKEPGSPAAISIAFGTLPRNVFIRGSRYRIPFCRLVSPRFTEDVARLATWTMDIRQVISDNAMKDLLAEEDARWIEEMNALMLGPNVPVPYNGNVAQWETIEGGISRETLMDALMIINRGPSQLESHTVLVNTVFIKHVAKWGRDEMGGDISEQVLRNGWAELELYNKKWIVTIKRNLIADNTMYMLADPRFIGKFFEWEPPTMYVDQRAYMIEFFLYETVGGGIGHSGGITRADFLGV